MGMKETYDGVQKAVEAKDFDLLRTYIAEDFVMVEPEALPYGGEWHGPEGFVDLVQTLRNSFGIDVVKGPSLVRYPEGPPLAALGPEGP